MDRILVRRGARCQEHPHRVLDEGWGWAAGSGVGPAEPKCDRCAQPFCRECLTPTERFADGTRHWFCAKCHVLFRRNVERSERERSLAYKAARAAARTRALVLTGIGITALVACTAGAVLLTTRLISGGRVAEPGAQLAATCGELSRIRSIGAIGTQGAEDAVNLLTYPRRAAVTLDLPPLVAGAADPTALVDECDAGWRVAAPTQLPLTFTFTIDKTGAYAQRLAIWQDPSSARAAWVRDFEVLSSPSIEGEDFQPMTLDRPTQLRETVEPQWFEISRRGPGAVPTLFPEAIPIQRLRLRVLSTVGNTRLRSQVDAIALGEVALYGPDLEIIARNALDGNTGAESPDVFEFVPGVINALAGRPKFVLIFNRSKSTSHVLATSAQQQNGEVTVGPGEAKSIQFVAAGRPGRYEFFCKVPGHAARGMLGRIEVR